MLADLLGNQTLARILFFLFVNERCYPTQIHRQLGIPLTPLQKGCEKLEKAGVLVSDYIGKTRLYRFHLAYPLLQELEQLIKKSYTLLSSQEKKRYTLVKRDRPVRDLRSVLLNCWEHLMSVRHVHFEAKIDQLGERRRRKGEGEVMVIKEGASQLIFQEKGLTSDGEGSSIRFTNTFRWTLDRSACLLTLEHLRFGKERPVFIFHLAPSGEASLASQDSHLMEGDTYLGQIDFDRNGLRLLWRVIGPVKNEQVESHYF